MLRWQLTSFTVYCGGSMKILKKWKVWERCGRMRRGVFGTLKRALSGILSYSGSKLVTRKGDSALPNISLYWCWDWKAFPRSAGLLRMDFEGVVWWRIPNCLIRFRDELLKTASTRGLHLLNKLLRLRAMDSFIWINPSYSVYPSNLSQWFSHVLTHWLLWIQFGVSKYNNEALSSSWQMLLLLWWLEPFWKRSPVVENSGSDKREIFFAWDPKKTEKQPCASYSYGAFQHSIPFVCFFFSLLSADSHKFWMMMGLSMILHLATFSKGDGCMATLYVKKRVRL